MAIRPLYYLESDDYARRTGGWVYNNHLLSALCAAGVEVVRFGFADFFSGPPGVAALRDRFAELPRASIVLADHLYAMELPSGQDKTLVSIFHHFLEEETRDTPLGDRVRDAELSALRAARLVICTSETTGRRILSEADIDQYRLIVAPPGLDRQPLSAPHSGGPWNLLSVGAVIPRKRYEFLIAAAADLTGRNWRLGIVGNLTRYPGYVAKLETMIHQFGLAGQIKLLGELNDEELEQQWRNAHLYVASSAHEGYGLAVAEALLRGVPTITTKSGAVGEWAANGVLLVEPEEPQPMAELISSLLANNSQYGAARRRALEFGASIPTWRQALSTAVGRIIDLAKD